MALPSTMKALWYEKPGDFAIVELPVPSVGDHDVLLKVRACGVCGTDLHIHKGDLPEEFPAKYPLVPGHEVVGTVAAVGKNITRIAVGQRVVAGANVPCNDCFFCLRGEHLLCEKMKCIGLTANGGFAEYCLFPSSKVVPITTLTDVEAVLIEAASCAAQMLDRIAPRIGSTVLVFGAGPAGLLIAQLLKNNGGCRVVLASLPGAKLDLGRQIGAADEFVQVGGPIPDLALAELRQRYHHGFDVVVEATGVAEVLEHSLNYVRRGGKLAVFGVYSSGARVTWSPSKILANQLSVVGSIAEVIRFPVSVGYLESSRVNVRGIANKKFKLEQWQEALDGFGQPDTVKSVIVFEDE